MDNNSFRRYLTNDDNLTLVDTILRQALMSEFSKYWLTAKTLMDHVFIWNNYRGEIQFIYSKENAVINSIRINAPKDEVTGLSEYVIEATEKDLLSITDEQIAKEWVMGVILDDYIRRKTWNPLCRRLLPQLNDLLALRLQSSLGNALGGLYDIDIVCVSMDRANLNKNISEIKVSDDSFMLIVKDVVSETPNGIIGAFDKLSTESIPAAGIPINTITSDGLRKGAHQPKSPSAYIVQDAEVKSIQIAAIVLPIVRDVASRLKYHVFNGGYYILQNDFVLMFRLIDA